MDDVERALLREEHEPVELTGLPKAIDVCEAAVVTELDDGKHDELREAIRVLINIAKGKTTGPYAGTLRDRIRAEVSPWSGHLTSKGEPCSWKCPENARDVVPRISFLACPRCGCVLKNRSGKRGVYNHEIIWIGRLPNRMELEFRLMADKTTSVRHVGDATWTDTSAQAHADVLAHLQLLLKEPAPQMTNIIGAHHEPFLSGLPPVEDKGQ